MNEETEPHPLTHYGKCKLEAERMVRASRPDAVIVRPPVVYGPRDTDVFQMLKMVAKGWSLEMTGGERWFSAICVGDLAAGLVRLAASRAGAGRTYYFAHEQPVSWGGLAACAARIMGVKLRVVRILPALALAVGACAEVWSHITGKPGIISREKVAEGRCAAWTCDTRRAARGVRVCRRRRSWSRTGRDPGLVQGGRLAELLKASAADRRFWAVDKLILAYVVFTAVLLLGWWRQYRMRRRWRLAHLAGVALLLFEVKAPIAPAGSSGTGIRCLTWGPVTRKWRC